MPHAVGKPWRILARRSLFATPRGLEKLSVEETAVTDVGLLAVAEKAKKLTQVDARKSKISKKGADDAGKKLPELVVSFE